VDQIRAGGDPQPLSTAHDIPFYLVIGVLDFLALGMIG
jgi:hypothetical protein